MTATRQDINNTLNTLNEVFGNSYEIIRTLCLISLERNSIPRDGCEGLLQSIDDYKKDVSRVMGLETEAEAGYGVNYK